MTVTATDTPAARQPSPTRRWLGFTSREHLAALAIFAIVTSLFFFPVVRHDTYSDVAGRQQQIYPWAGVVTREPGYSVLHYDQSESFYPWQVFMSRALRNGEFPLWNPYSFAGAPFFANGQSGVLYPPRLALTYTVAPTRVHDGLLVSHLFLAGVAMFLLLGFVGVSFPAALVGGLAWMLNSFALAWQALEHYLAIAVWLPVGMLLVDAVVRRRSWAATFGLVLALGMMFVGGNVLFVELALVAIIGYAIALAIADARHDWRRLTGTAARLAAAGVLFAALTAFSTLPTFKLTEESARVSLSHSELGEFALPWDKLVNILSRPDLLEFDPYHFDLFAGTVVALLALVGLLRRETLARFAAVLGVLTILFMLHSPVTYVVDRVLPGFGNFKPLGRAAFLLQFALAVLGAFGLDTILRSLRHGRLHRVARSPHLVAALVGSAVGAVIMRFGVADLHSEGAFILGVAAAVALALALELARMRADALIRIGSRVSTRGLIRVSASALIVVAVAGSIVAQAWPWKRSVMLHQPNEPGYLYPPTPLIDYLEQRPEARILPTETSFRGATAMIYPLQSAGGYESLLPARIQNLWRVLGDDLPPQTLESRPLIYAYYTQFAFSNLRPRLLARAGVSYVVTPPPDASSGPIPRGLRLRYDGGDGRVYAVADALPRTYVVGGCEQAATPLAALERFVADDFAAGRSVVLEQPFLREAGFSCAGASHGRAGSASVLDRSLNSLRVRVQAQRPAWLVVAESWDSGWSAKVDDRRTEVLPANSAFRAVRIPRGVHTVELTYRPSRFGIGVVVSLTALVLTIAGLILALVASSRRKLGTERPQADGSGGRQGGGN